MSNGIHADGFGLSYGVGINDALIQSGSTNGTQVTGVVWHLKHLTQWSDGDRNKKGPTWITDATFRVDVEWQHLSGNQQQTLQITSLKPSLEWSLNQHWSWDTAMGIAFLSERRYEEIETSSRWQFAIHLGLNWYFRESSSWRASLRYNHFSNGYLNQPNPGIDFITLSISHFW